jgi:hypothetical protein
MMSMRRDELDCVMESIVDKVVYDGWRKTPLRPPPLKPLRPYITKPLIYLDYCQASPSELKGSMKRIMETKEGVQPEGVDTGL